ncbi:hypothetical protein BH09VER1_BH09VER1_25560 [soil metagenome]
MYHLVLDIGGSWLKGAAVDERIPEESLAGWTAEAGRIKRCPAPRNAGEISDALIALAKECREGRKLHSTVISTAGIVHPSGRQVVRCAEHLAFLREPGWVERLRETLDGPVTLINDAEAFLLGAAVLGHVPRRGTVCCLVIGTGLGCAIAKDGHLWRPQRSHPLLGSIRLDEGRSYDSLASAARLAACDPQGDLVRCLQAPEFQGERDRYFGNLAAIGVTATILYGADHLLIGGGLCDAAERAGLELRAEVQKHWRDLPPELGAWPQLEIVREGNAALLVGAAAFSAGMGAASVEEENLASLPTEQIDPAAEDIHLRTPREIIGILGQAESMADEQLGGALDELGAVAGEVIERWNQGGRIIYLGAGTSGRVAAMDAVEIPCTFGSEPDRVVAVVAGGVAEAALSIEQDGEEDTSSVPDLILLRLGPNDTVVGISASGSSIFVRTGLAYAKRRGAATVMILAGATESRPEWDRTIRLRSGVEVVAGSTRMKAGTATKKVLNFLTTTVLAKSGKLRGPYMIDMECLNAKLRSRARRILEDLYSLPAAEAEAVLARNDFKLRKAIEEVEQRAGCE